MSPLWPPVEYETHSWTPEQGHSNRASRFGDYQSALVPMIAGTSPSVGVSTAAHLDEASTEIARFDAEMGGEIAPFAAVLLRSESAASSKIEFLTASAKAIALAELGDTSRRNATEIVGNTHAMHAAVDRSDRLDDTTILAMHHALIGDDDLRIPGGQWRTEQVWIGGGATPHTAAFVPPHHGRVADAINDLIAFIARDDLPVVLQTALAHAQFETIHPFPDGNGRTGRALVHAMLRGRRLTRNITVPVSAGLLADTDGYIAALNAYRVGDIEPIAQSFADAAFRAIGNGRALVEDIRSIRAQWGAVHPTRRGSAAQRILDGLARQPVMDSAYAQRELGISSSAAQRAFTDLEAAGIVVEFSGMKRNRCWRSDDMLAALDGFADRAGRRG